MSEATLPTPGKKKFDDRVDTNPAISSGEALVLLGRALQLLNHVRQLFAAKSALALLAIFPPLVVPWIAKIIVDQVLLQKPFGTTDVRFPPFLDWFLGFISDKSPMEIMGTIVVMYAFLVILFGLRAGAATSAFLTQGHDAATQSELALNAGGSKSGGIFGMIEMIVSIRLTQNIANTLRTTLFRKLARLPMTTLDDNRIGDSVYRVMYDTPQVPEICFNLTLIPVLSLLSAAISLYLMQYSYGQVAPELVWIAASLIPLAFIVTLPMSTFARNLNQASRASGAATTNAIEESMENIAAVKSLGGSAREREQFAKKSAESFKRHRYAFLFSQGLYVIGGISTGVAAIYVTILITDRIIAGIMTPGDFAVLFGLFYSLGGTAMAIGMYWIGLQSNVAAIRRVFFFIDFPTETPGARATTHETVKRSVTFDHVSYNYPNGAPVLTDINLTLEVGELIAIVGPTGAGKTTLAYMLPAFLRSSAGRVMFDDINISNLDVDTIRDQVTYVFQEHTLLSESIRNNLLLAKPDATDGDIRQACKTAGALTFIDALPDGLDTVLGRAGNTLSVGQQQRLSIARGLVRNTPILVLDEPTAALDPETEHTLVSALQDATAGKLVIVIAHRLSTIRKADRIVFMEDGRIKDIGNHDTLMADPNGSYKKFVKLQAG